jgi:hypothetical protein
MPSNEASISRQIVNMILQMAAIPSCRAAP